MAINDIPPGASRLAALCRTNQGSGKCSRLCHNTMTSNFFSMALIVAAGSDDWIASTPTTEFRKSTHAPFISIAVTSKPASFALQLKRPIHGPTSSNLPCCLYLESVPIDRPLSWPSLLAATDSWGSAGILLCSKDCYPPVADLETSCRNPSTDKNEKHHEPSSG